VGHFAHLDPDPDSESGSGSTTLVLYLAPDPDPATQIITDPKPQPEFLFSLILNGFRLLKTCGRYRTCTVPVPYKDLFLAGCGSCDQFCRSRFIESRFFG
jgi:hypothetical protein